MTVALRNLLMEPAHAGHNHGALGEWIESLFAMLPLSESWREFWTHFVVDTLNIFFLLLVVMAFVYFLSSYIPMERLHHKLTRLKSLPGFALAITAGALSPFCSCSIIPILIGLISVGVPVSVCLCYLTASSMLNITAVFSLFAVAGPHFSIAYLFCALGITVASSLLFSLMRLDSGAKHYVDEHHHHHEIAVCDHCVWHRLRCALLSTLNVFKKCWVYIILGVLLSSAVTAFLSIDSITRVVNENSFLSATVVSIVGIPIHSDIFSISPVLDLLISISPGVGLAFAMSTMAISIPSIVILTRALKTKTVVLYCGTIIVLTLAAGYLAVFLL